MRHWITLLLLVPLLGIALWQRPVFGATPGSPFIGPYEGEPYYYQPTIQTLTLLNDTTTFAPGEKICIEMTGTAHGVATFDVAGVKHGIRMKETSPGQYRGSFVAPVNIRAFNARLLGHLTYGRTTTAEAIARVTITDGAMFVTVTSPRIDQRLTATSFKVVGKTVPNAKLTINIRVLTAPIKASFVFVGGTADANGNFRIPVRMNLGEMPARLNDGMELNVSATDGASTANTEVRFNIATGE